MEQGYIKCRTTKDIKWNSKKDHNNLMNNRATLLLKEDEMTNLSQIGIKVTKI